MGEGSRISVKKKGDALEFTETAPKKRKANPPKNKQRPKTEEIEG